MTPAGSAAPQGPASPEAARRPLLEGLCAVVTGASSGIGAAVARRFADEGAQVLAVSRSESRVAGVRWQQADVRIAAEVDAAVASAVDAFGRLDVIVNNAGVQLEKTVDSTSDDDYDAVMDVNVRGVFNCCRAAVRQMKAQGGGVIVNIGSVAGNAADHKMAVYNASKGAVHALTRAIAVDHGPDGIRCNAVSPGWILTEMAEAAFALADDPDRARAAAVARHPLGRMGTPDDVAGLAVFLASADAAFVSGACLTVDGALTAQSPIAPADG